MSATRHEAAIVAVGSELTLGLRLDTNTQQVAAALSRHGYVVAEAITMADDVEMLASALARLCDTYPLVIVTGGLGPTHDDVTRDAAARALSIPLEQDENMLVWLEDIAKRHGDPAAAAQVFRQADVLTGATILRPASGTAPGQIAPTELGRLVLLPGPPHEMYPMLLDAIGGEDAPISTTLRCVGITESDAQVRAGRIVSSSPGVTLTVLASPSMVDVILVDTGAGEAGVGRVAEAIEEELADYVYGREEATLAGAVLGEARDSNVTLALAESCTGGMLAAALTDEAGASDVFQGGVVAYANAVKSQVLGVEQDDLEQHGAVSARVAEAMASGVADRLDADIALSVTGIAGPDGGTDEKPVGLVWFGLCDRGTVTSFGRQFPGDRLRVRTRAVVAGLNALRLALRS
jgi:nicotinamide-nucleotide amidase